MKKLVIVMLVGSVGWFLKEVMELGLGNRTSATLGLTSIFGVLLAVGIWGLFLALSKEQGRTDFLGLIGVAFTSLGTLVMAVPTMRVARSYDLELLSVIEESKLFSTATVAVVIGTVLFAGSLLKAGTKPKWAVIALAACPPVAFLIPGWSLALNNLVLGAWALALVALTFSVLEPAPKVSEPVPAS